MCKYIIPGAPEAGEEPEFVRAKYFFRDEFLVSFHIVMALLCSFIIYEFIINCYIISVRVLLRRRVCVCFILWNI